MDVSNLTIICECGNELEAHGHGPSYRQIIHYRCRNCDYEIEVNEID